MKNRTFNPHSINIETSFEMVYILPSQTILTMNEISVELTDNQKFLNKQAKFGFTVRNKSITNLNLKNAIDEYLKRYDIELPDKKSEFERLKDRFFDYDAYGDALENELGQIIKLRYAISQVKGYYAMFTEGNNKVLQPMAFWYSKHRLCAVWNWRKSQIIRKRYHDYLQVGVDLEGNKLIEHYQPIHMVLTVPHENGEFQGKTFYVKELIECFKAMRKTDIFKKYVYGGEYGVEVKKSKSAGLHIHIHSFLLQKPEYDVNEAREAIIDVWKQYTGNLTDYSGLHYETLYTWKRDEKGKIMYETFTYDDSEGNEEIIKQKPIKDYVNPKTSDINHYLSGVLECIKYHFKPDCLEKSKGEYDMELIIEILNNTKNQRLYSRFLAFHSVSELSFNNLQKEKEESENNEENVIETDVEESAEVSTTTDGVEERVISPFTQEKVSKRTDYQIVIVSPLSVKYREKLSEKPLENFVYTTKGLIVTCQSLSLKEVIKLDLMGLNMADFDNQEAINAFTEKTELRLKKRPKNALEEKISSFRDRDKLKNVPIKRVIRRKRLNKKSQMEEMINQFKMDGYNVVER